MEAPRLVLVTLVTWGLGVWLLRTVVVGLRSGSIPHTDASSQFARSDDPADMGSSLWDSLSVRRCARRCGWRCCLTWWGEHRVLVWGRPCDRLRGAQ